MDIGLGGTEELSKILHALGPKGLKPIYYSILDPKDTK